jgi:ABC-2 type transport system permease protein
MDKYATESMQLDVGTIIVESGENREIITSDQFFTGDYFDDTTTYIDIEKRITNAIMLVTDQISESNIYLDVMHTNEDYRQYSLMMGAFLKGEGYSCDVVDMSTTGIPEDADIIISVSPRYDYTENEIKLLNEFLSNGGKLVVLGSEGLSPLENLDALLLEWGIKLNYDYVIEPDENSSIPNQSGLPVPVAKYDQQHTITEKIATSDMHLVMPNTMSVSVVKSTNGSDPVQLLKTSEKAYSKKSIDTLDIAEGDTKGPLGLAAISIKVEKEASGVMVVGSVDGFLSQIYEGDGSYLNIDFLLNSLSYLGGAEESIDIRAKQITPQEMVVTQQQYSVINVVLVWIIPIAIILLGIVIWLRRRFK